MSTLDNRRVLVEQLRREANISRVKVSVACADLIKYCQDHQDADILVTGAKDQNPYEPKKHVCALI